MTHKTILYDGLTAISIYDILKTKYQDKISFLFESAINTDKGNFSFIFIDYLERIQFKNVKNEDASFLYYKDKSIKSIDENPFDFLKEYYENIDKDKYKKLTKELDIGFVDGFIGYIGYESISLFEPVMKPFIDELEDELNIPDIDLIRPKLTLAYSHKTNKLTIISNSNEYVVEDIEDILKQAYKPKNLENSVLDKDNNKFSISKDEFFNIVKESKKNIENGDLFQILISNRFTQQGSVDKLSFYRILRSKNPSPYMFLLDFNDFAIVGSSPEVMVALKDDEILLRPIAGTRKRGETTLKDLEMERELLSDEKERSEHIMLVDLGRNDLGRVAKTGSVKVTSLMHVERYSHVMHIVSDVKATLDKKYDMFDLLQATFTAGTMSGAPKIKAMQLITKYEKIKRNFYSGVVGYFGYDGNMDSSIAIRTSYIDDEKIIFQAGAGVVTDSVAKMEYLEVHNKLGAMMMSLETSTRQS